jgi:uncharacterized protein (DUF2235 family)
VQLPLYIQGVGTKPKFDDLSWVDEDYRAQLSKLLGGEFWGPVPDFVREKWGGAFGKGTAARIRGAYHFVCRHYRERSTDRVFLFGFSRGAFAARSLAGFLDFVGLLLLGHLDKVEEAWMLYERATDPAQSELQDFLYKLTGYRRATRDQFFVPMHFVGVWDTVASLGIPSRQGWVMAPFTEFHQVDVPPAVMTARHAIATHEIRSTFEPLLWKSSSSHTDLMQVWFPGAHADVGGGYKAGDDKLSDNTLRWMTREATKCGLLVKSSSPWVLQPDALDAVHHEIRGLFITSTPTPRLWLGGREPTDGYHVHRTLAEYLLEFIHDYRFNRPFVNAALRRVDELAFLRFLHTRFDGREVVS